MKIVTFSVAVIAFSTLAECICPDMYNVEIEGVCYAYINQMTLSWIDAKQYCQNNEGQLAVIKDCYQFQQVVRMLHINAMEASAPEAQPFYWIGGQDQTEENIWTWVDSTSMALGSPFWGSDEFGNHQPDGESNSYEDCACLFMKDQYYFHDEDCDQEANFICQTFAE